jgi:hypothetical protein
VSTIDRPTAVIIPTQDHVVAPEHQERLLASIPAAVGFHVDGDHDVCVAGPEQFMPALISACHLVTGGRAAAAG